MLQYDLSHRKTFVEQMQAAHPGDTCVWSPDNPFNALPARYRHIEGFGIREVTTVAEMNAASRLEQEARLAAVKELYPSNKHGNDCTCETCTVIREINERAE